MKKSISRISQTDWNRAYPALKGFAITTLEIAEAVLVEGKKPADVSKERNITRQNVYAAVKRVTSILDKQEIEGLHHVDVWLPKDQAEEVYKMAEPYMKKTK
ncbi:TrfB-related DNA-binding protein [Photorhabdus africana]|uniref:TrfB-related DNA-binding protein n=1 Tax=Photorhabdus africana TaxID=3097554 RepID=UPI002B40967F|nr:TrfB-related DNA-binding protein [Photorhabdus sp. CRI-LC]